MARRNLVEDPELGRLTDDRLTRDLRVWQREKGHRFSSDDVATAYVAHQACPRARRILDLGCGLGSVLLQLAWKQPQARLWGVEAQAQSYALLARNVTRAAYGDRLNVVHGDVRDEALMTTLGSDFDLVTGTPPYFPLPAALTAEDEQRAYARLEYRGGIEAYIDAGARRLAADGRLVLCGDARALLRTTSACARASLHIQARCDVLPRRGKSPLFSVWTLGWSPQSCHISELTLRSEAGAPDEGAMRLREFGGF